MTRIGIVVPRYPPNVKGGGEISVHLLAKELLNRDHDVTVLSFDGTGPKIYEGIHVLRRYLPPQEGRLREIRAIKALKNLNHFCQDMDVIHGYNHDLYPALGILARFTTTPIVATLNAYELCKTWQMPGFEDYVPQTWYKGFYLEYWNWLGKILMKEIDQFIAISHAVKDKYQEVGLTESKIEVIPNMYDKEFLRRLDSSPQKSHSSGCTRILYVGKFQRWKGVRFLIKAMTYLKDEDIKLKIVAYGPREKEFRKLVYKYGLQDIISITGYMNYAEIPKLYREADMFVNPGVWPEPFGRTILEAMLAELPVISTNVGGPREIVPQKNLLVPPQSPEAIAEKIKMLLENPEKRKEIGKKNRQIAIRKYAPEKVISQIERVYDSLIIKK